jgi:hypothetical protein
MTNDGNTDFGAEAAGDDSEMGAGKKEGRSVICRISFPFEKEALYQYVPCIPDNVRVPIINHS